MVCPAALSASGGLHRGMLILIVTLILIVMSCFCIFINLQLHNWSWSNQDGTNARFNVKANILGHFVLHDDPLSI